MNELLNNNIDELYVSISSKINETKSKVIKSVNTGIVQLYWNIGKIISDDILNNHRAEYGKNIIELLSGRLSKEYGKGFDKSSISRMVKFYQEFQDEQIVATLSQQLTWSHFIELLPISDENERNFYANMCLNELWSIRDLRDRKKSMLYQRTAISKRPNELIKKELDTLRVKKTMDTDLFYRDPYILDFLGLKDTYSEKDLENAILVELEKFILEMGNDFAFLARQKHIIIDGRDYFIDLLFFHRTLNRLVLIELKLGEFEPQDKGQTELYLKWVEKYEKKDTENSPIALILCAKKSEETVELMELNKGNIRVSEYMLKMPPKDLLEEKLKQAIKNAKARIEAQNE